MKPTIDPYTVILEESKEPGKEYVIYQDLKSKEKWIIRGKCNRCGLCEANDGSLPYITWDPTKHQGEENACCDTRVVEGRLDVPMRPEGIAKSKNEYGKCVMEGEYL